MEKITSRANPLMTHIRKMSSSGSYRRQTGEYLCDSPKLLAEAVQWGADIVTVVVTADPRISDASAMAVAHTLLMKQRPSPLQIWRHGRPPRVKTAAS